VAKDESEAEASAKGMAGQKMARERRKTIGIVKSNEKSVVSKVCSNGVKRNWRRSYQREIHQWQMAGESIGVTSVWRKYQRGRKE